MVEKRIDWYRTPLQGGQLQELTKKNDGKALLQVLGFLVVLIALGGLAAWAFFARLWIPMVVACYLYSTVFFFVSMAAAVHELSHGTAFTNRKLNDFFYNLFSFLTWNNPVHFRASHTYHHQFTVHRGVDLEVQQGPVAEKLNALNLLYWFTFDLSWFLKLTGLAIAHAFGNTDADYFFWKPLFDRDDPRRKQMILWARIILFGHIALVAVFAFLQLWIFIYLLTFGSFFAGWLGRFCGAIQHTGLSESTPDWRVVCHTVECGPIIRFLYWNMNYHIEHHMYAAVPFYNLPKLHRLVAHDYPVPQKSFWSCVATLYRIKREQNKDPSYLFVPEFPPTATPVRWQEAAK